jgi:GT2 family glycosyltransferase
MPVFNGEQYLESAIDSIRRQTWTDLELIIVDDGSTDRTPGILQAQAAQDARLVLLRHETNLGLTHSLNRGLAAARGYLVARQDSDDLSAPERLERQVVYLRARPEIGVLATAIAIIDGSGRIAQARYFDTWLTNAALQKQLLRDYCIGHGSVMMRRACLTQVGGYDPAMEPAEDHDLWLRLAEVTQLASLPESLYLYRHHPESVSHMRRSQQVLRVAQGIESALHRRQAAAPSTAGLHLAARAYLRAALTAAATSDLLGARERLAHALALDARLLDRDEPLAELAGDQTTRGTAAAGVAFYDEFFAACLPRTRRLARLRARLIGRLYMREVFAGARQRDRRHVGAHLWPGLRADPAWLLNRGVLAITARQLLPPTAGQKG